jgi:predicted ribosomally synthesized peptide with SipW-like signal peptide
MPKEFNISRRKALAALGTIGVASAGAGVGTSAYLNDTEVLSGNSVQAGTLNMKLAVDAFGANTNAIVEANGNDVPLDSKGSGVVVVDGETITRDGTDLNVTSASINLKDLKPGDRFVICWEPRIRGNPAYVGARGSAGDDLENGYTEPEPNPGSDSDGGELDDKAQVHVYNSYDSNDGLQGEDESLSGSLADFISALESGGIDFRNANGNLIKVPDGKSETIYTEFKIPETVGNEIQGDSFGFDVEFVAEQTRHNDGSDPLSGTPGDP